MLAACLGTLVTIGAVGASGAAECEKDVAFAIEELGRRCATLIAQKQIDWKKVGDEISAAAKDVKDDSDHLLVLCRLIARLQDGHAEVQPTERGRSIRLPAKFAAELGGPGLFFCRAGDKLDRILVKNAWRTAGEAGVKPGMEVVKLDGKPALEWMKARVAELRDVQCFSTEQQAWFFACHQGLALEKGRKLELELKDAKGKKLTRTVICGDANQVPQGPAFFPEKLESTKDLNFGRTAGGFGYVHVRRSPGDLPEQIDVALQKLAPDDQEVASLREVPGLILDFRGNSGGGFDQDALMGRFVPAGKTLSFGKSYASAGPAQYGGPIVVIIDATVRSAGETASGMFKEDGRAYMIGESPTAGMSSLKETIELPSGLFSLYVSVASNKGRFNDGRGIEGIGVMPHELVTFEAKDLDRGIDTLIAKAEALLKKFPAAKVPYDPKAFGWK
jgi:carboxyl-terminal processing protease